MSACKSTDTLIATYHHPQKGETVEVRCHTCGSIVATINEPESRQHVALQNRIRIVWKMHIDPDRVDFQI